MKYKVLAAAVATTLLLAGCNEAKEDAAVEEVVAATELATQEQKLSYVLGKNIGGQLKADGIPVDVNILAEGMSDALEGKESRINDEEAAAVMMAFQEQKMAEMQQAMDDATEKNRLEGEAYLAENGQKEGVVTLESGLQYKVVTEGDGPIPTAENTVEVHYKGTLIDGTEFDSSFKRGVPATFGVTQVIPGWTEALQLMKEGSKWELYIPPSLAYGPGGAGGLIGPEQTLIFEVELLKADASEEEETEETAEETATEAEAAAE